MPGLSPHPPQLRKVVLQLGKSGCGFPHASGAPANPKTGGGYLCKCTQAQHKEKPPLLWGNSPRLRSAFTEMWHRPSVSRPAPPSSQPALWARKSFGKFVLRSNPNSAYICASSGFLSKKYIKRSTWLSVNKEFWLKQWVTVFLRLWCVHSRGRPKQQQPSFRWTNRCYCYMALKMNNKMFLVREKNNLWRFNWLWGERCRFPSLMWKRSVNS